MELIREDELLWVAGQSDAPLLASTQKLLKLLREKPNIRDDLLEDLEPNESLLEQPNNIVNDGSTKEKSISVTSNEDKGERIMNEKVTQEVEPTDDGEEQKTRYSNLERVENMGDLIRTAIADTRNLKHRSYERSKSSLSEVQRRHMALEQQCLRFQKLHVKNGQNEYTDNADSSNSDDDTTTEDPWVTLARTLNSLRLLTPVLLKMLLHKDCRNRDLYMGDYGKLREKREQKCWLIGEYVFDTTTVRSCKKCYFQLQEVYEFLGVHRDTEWATSTSTNTDSTRQPWQKVLDNAMEQVMDYCSSGNLSDTNSPPTPPKWTQKHPLDGFDTNIRDKLDVLTSTIDKQFGLDSDKDPDQHTKYLQCIESLHTRLKKILTKRFPGSTLSVYGSCLSDLSLGKAADVDLSLHIPYLKYAKDSFGNGEMSVAIYEKTVKTHVYQTCRSLEHRTHEFANMVPITRASCARSQGDIHNGQQSTHGQWQYWLWYLSP